MELFPPLLLSSCMTRTMPLFPMKWPRQLLTRMMTLRRQPRLRQRSPHQRTCPPYRRTRLCPRHRPANPSVSSEDTAGPRRAPSNTEPRGSCRCRRRLAYRLPSHSEVSRRYRLVRSLLDRRPRDVRSRSRVPSVVVSHLIKLRQPPAMRTCHRHLQRAVVPPTMFMCLGLVVLSRARALTWRFVPTRSLSGKPLTMLPHHRCLGIPLALPCLVTFAARVRYMPTRMVCIQRSITLKSSVFGCWVSRLLSVTGRQLLTMQSATRLLFVLSRKLYAFSSTLTRILDPCTITPIVFTTKKATR